MATRREKEFTLAQNVLKTRIKREILLKKAQDLSQIDNSKYNSWYADWILHPTNDRVQIRKVGNKRMPKTHNGRPQQKALLFGALNGSKRLRRQKLLIPDGKRQAAKAIGCWYDPVNKKEGEVRQFPSPGGEDLEKE